MTKTSTETMTSSMKLIQRGVPDGSSPPALQASSKHGLNIASNIQNVSNHGLGAASASKTLISEKPFSCGAKRQFFILDSTCLSKYTYDRMISRPLSGINSLDLEQMVEKEGFSEFDTDKLEATLKLWGVMPIAKDKGVGVFHQVRKDPCHKNRIHCGQNRRSARIRAPI